MCDEPGPVLVLADAHNRQPRLLGPCGLCYSLSSSSASFDPICKSHCVSLAEQAGERAQWAKALVCKCEAQSSDPQHLYKCLVGLVTCLQSQHS